MIPPAECPPLIAENVGKPDNYYCPITLERVAAAVIDFSWHYSWHWDRDDTHTWRPLSLRGWQAALADGQSLLDKLEAHAQEIRDVLPLIQAEIEQIERRAEEDLKANVRPFKRGKELSND